MHQWCNHADDSLISQSLSWKLRRKDTLTPHSLFLPCFCDFFYRARRDELEKMEAPVWKDRRCQSLLTPNSSNEICVCWQKIYRYTFFLGRSGSKWLSRSWWNRGELRVSEVGQGQTWQAWLENNQTYNLLITWGVCFWMNKSFCLLRENQDTTERR